MNIYLVGGAVRDRLLGLPVKDRDWVVVGATPQEMIDQGFRPVGRDFPVFLHPQTHEEYALARTERKTGPGYTGFAFHAAPDVSLEEDLRRRDLTINAMAEHADGTLIDPFGGEADLRAGFLRHVSESFTEDPVRILRVARLAARYARQGFRVAHGTHRLMKQMVADGEVDALVAERVWTEMERALSEEHPRRFFEVLRACGALGRLMPELDALFGVPQPAHHHPEVDTGAHVLLVLERACELSADPRVRFAALVHDLGKAQTPRERLPAHHGHEARSVEQVQALADRLRIPRDYRELAVLVARYHSHCHRAAELRPAKILAVLEAVDVFRRPERFESFLLACQADALGRAGKQGEPYPQAERMRRAATAARAVDAAPFADLPGPEVAKRLREARVEAISSLPS